MNLQRENTNSQGILETKIVFKRFFKDFLYAKINLSQKYVFTIGAHLTNRFGTTLRKDITS